MAVLMVGREEGGVKKMSLYRVVGFWDWGWSRVGGVCALSGVEVIIVIIRWAVIGIASAEK